MEMKFIDPKTDYAFKRIFGSEDSHDTLISFIDASLKLKGDRRVKTVHIKNPYQTPTLPVLKESIVDISCTDYRGVRYLVEMQVEKVKGFANRIIHNLTKCYCGQAEKGRAYPDMNDVVLIAVMDFVLFEKFDPYHSIFVLQDIETNFAPFNQLKICCLELKKFAKEEAELKDMLDKWIYFLKEAPNLEVRPSILEEEVFVQAFEKAKTSNLTPEEKEIYDAAKIAATDKKGMIEQALEDGLQKGLQKGRQKGREEEREQVALRMIENGFNVEDICKLTDLSLKEVENMKADSIIRK